MTNIQILIRKHHIQLAKQGTEDALKMGKKPTKEEFEILKASKVEIIAELRRQWYEEDEKELIEENKQIKKQLEMDTIRIAKSDYKKKTIKTESKPTTKNVYAYGECIGTEKIK